MNIILTDQIGQQLETLKNLQRIISLVPSQTELLCELGLEEKIVGITKFCVHPYHLKSVKQIVGGTKKVDYKKIQMLHPDIIICNKEENTQEMVAALKEICPVWVTNIVTIEDNFKMISDFGQLFNCRIEAQKWNDKLTYALLDFRNFIQNQPLRKVVYFIWKNPYMVAGADNYINELLRLNRFNNIYDIPESTQRYPTIDLTKMREADPELVLLSSEPFPFKEEDAFEIGRFTHHAKTIFVDGEMFSWYGSRLLQSLKYFKNLHQRL